MSFPVELLRVGSEASYADFTACKSGPFVATFPDGERSPEFPTPGRLLAWMGTHRQGRSATTNIITKHEIGQRTYYVRYVEAGANPTAELADMARLRGEA